MHESVALSCAPKDKKSRDGVEIINSFTLSVIGVVVTKC